MKKIIFTLLSIFAFTFVTYAQDAKASCKMPGTYDYMTADFYKGQSQGDGSIRISNQASVPVVEVKVRVTCEYFDANNEWGANWTETTLYNQTVYGVPAQGYKDIKVRMPKYTKIRNFKVEIGNLICK